MDILVNNAGITRDKLAMTMSEEEFTRVLSVNLSGAFYCARQIIPVLVRKKSGRIINIASVSGLMGNPGQSNYAASKAGLIGLTKTLARELASRNITCNAVAPGFVETDMTASLSGGGGSLAESIPLRIMLPIALNRINGIRIQPFQMEIRDLFRKLKRMSKNEQQRLASVRQHIFKCSITCFAVRCKTIEFPKCNNMTDFPV